MTNYHQALLDMDIERIIALMLIVSLAALVLFALTRIETRRWNPVRFFKYAIILMLLLEGLTRLFFFLRDWEPYILIYPLRAYTRDYLTLDYSPLYGFNTDGNLNSRIVSVARTYQGLHYYHATMNNRGFRFKPEQSAPNAFNIVVLGGSSTWGRNSDGKTFPDYLQRELGQEYGVYNLGQPAEFSDAYIDNLTDSWLLNQKTIHMAIVYCGHNDSDSHQMVFAGFKRYEGLFAYEAATTTIIRYSLLARILYLIRFSSIGERLIEESLRTKTACDVAYLNASQMKFESNLLKLISFLKSHNQKIKIVLVPEYTHYIVPVTQFHTPLPDCTATPLPMIPAYELINHDFKMKYQSMKVLAEKKKNVFFMGINFFDAYKREELLVDCVHLTDYGNEVLALHLRDYVLSLRKKQK